MAPSSSSPGDRSTPPPHRVHPLPPEPGEDPTWLDDTEPFDPDATQRLVDDWEARDIAPWQRDWP